MVPVTTKKPFWSPDGNLLYFLSSRDGFLCLWAQWLDPSTKHPLGDRSRCNLSIRAAIHWFGPVASACGSRETVRYSP